MQSVGLWLPLSMVEKGECRLAPISDCGADEQETHDQTFSIDNDTCTYNYVSWLLILVSNVSLNHFFSFVLTTF